MDAARAKASRAGEAEEGTIPAVGQICALLCLGRDATGDNLSCHDEHIQGVHADTSEPHC